MERSFLETTTRRGGPPGSLTRAGAGPVIAVVLAGLLAEVVNHEEASAGIDFGLSLLALLGATGCMVSLAGRLSSGLDPVPWIGAAGALRALVAPPAASAWGEDWPVLVALLFGALFVLISGLGGWV